jgi:hypothetical protein
VLNATAGAAGNAVPKADQQVLLATEQADTPVVEKTPSSVAT